MSSSDFFFVSETAFADERKIFVDIENIQKAGSKILKFQKSTLGVKSSFDMLIDRAQSCIDAEGHYFEHNQ